MNSSIIKQLFEIIKPKDDNTKYQNLKLKLAKTNIDYVMKQLIQNRKDNYFKQNELLNNEKKIIAEVNKLESILLIQ